MKEGVRSLAKEAFSGGRTVGTSQEEIVDRGEGLELTRAEPMETMTLQGELAISAFDTGTGALSII